jgi:hypothetical protein
MVFFKVQEVGVDNDEASVFVKTGLHSGDGCRVFFSDQRAAPVQV